MSLILWSNDQIPYLEKDIAGLISQSKIKHQVVELIKDKLPDTKPGDVLLAMGGEAKDTLAGMKLIPKGRTIGSLRNTLIKLPSDAVCLLTYSASIGEVDHSLYTDMLTDCQAAVRYKLNGNLDPQLGTYSYVEDFGFTLKRIAEIHEKTGKPVRVSLDTETLGTDRFSKDGYIISVQVCCEEGEADVIYFKNKHWCLIFNNNPNIRNNLATLLTSPIVSLRCANGKYDLEWMFQMWGLECTNFNFDTLLVGSLLDENRSNGLDVHAKIYVPTMAGYSDAFDKKWDKSRMDLVPKPELLIYGGADADATLRVSNVEANLLMKDAKLTKFYQTILHPAARAYEYVERVGWYVDRPYFEYLKEELEMDIDRLTKEAKEIVGGRIVIKNLDKEGRLNISKKSFLTDYMFSPMGLNLHPKMLTPKTREPSTALEHLMMFKDNPKAGPFVKVLKEFYSADKTYSTYVVGFLKHIRSDGRFHPVHWLFAGRDFSGDDDSGTVCVTADTVFMSNRGQVQYPDLQIGDSVISHQGVPRKVTGKINNGKKIVYRVSLSDGHIITCTGNHPFLTKRGWIEATSLEIGDEGVVYGNAEQWMLIPEWPFEVSNWGRIRSLVTGNICKVQKKNKWGHLKITLTKKAEKGKGRQQYDVMVHQLVAKAFCVKESTQYEVRHLNGISWDNTAWNLKWGTAKENRNDMRQHGSGRGTKPNQKLDWITVDYIRESPLKSSLIAKQVGVCARLIRALRQPSNKRWDVIKYTEKRCHFNHAIVVAVEKVEECPTFGIEVEVDHSHLTNGIVTHNTGRLSVKEPAVQTIPKHTAWAKRLRKAIIAPPGYVILAKDYKQGELKMVACFANEPTMLKAYLSGQDLHVVTAAKLTGMSVEEFMKLEKTDPEKFEFNRFLAKSLNFGLLYKMGAEGYMNYAQTEFGIDMSLEQATDNRNAFFDLYASLSSWHSYEEMMVKMQGFTRGPLGRIRHLPLIKSKNSAVYSKAIRQAINFKPQTTLSDMSLWSTAIMHKKGMTKLDPVFGMIHDQLLRYSREDHYEKVSADSSEIMENLPFKDFGWSPQLQFTVDSEVGTDLGSLKKIK